MYPAAQDTPHTGITPETRPLLSAVVLGVAYFALSTPAAYTSSPGVLAAIIWPAPALAAALLWRAPYRQWPLYLLFIFAAMLVVGDDDGLSVRADSAFALLNVVEVMLYAWLGRRFVSASGQIDSTRKLARFVGLLPLLATSVIAALGASIGTFIKGTVWADEWRVILVGNGLATMVLLPALLAWFPAESAAETTGVASRRGPSAIAAAVVSLLLLASAVLPAVSAEVLRALLTLTLVWAALYGGLRAASSGMLAAAMVGVGLTLMQLGPYGMKLRQDGAWALQLDLAALAVLSFFVAITVHEKRKLNSRLERARRLESMGLLAGGIAHDFNNILGAVGGYAELAASQVSGNAAAAGSLHEVERAVTRGRDLTAQILLAGKQGERARQQIDLGDVVIRSAALARPLLPPGIQMTLQVPVERVIIHGHEGQLVRALLNLMRNGALAAKSQVTVTLLLLPAAQAVAGANVLLGEEPRHDHFAMVDITDDGAGIATQHLQQLFDPFFSTRARRSADGGAATGTGLGLAIVAGVVTDHAGGIAVWTGRGNATRFRVMLPLLQLEPTETAAQPAFEAQQPGQGQRVLLVEADKARREQHEDWLAAMGLEPAGHETAGQALDQLAAAPAEFALLVLLSAPDTDTDIDTARQTLARARLLAPDMALIADDAQAVSCRITWHDGQLTLPPDCSEAGLLKAVTMALQSTGVRPPLSQPGNPL